MTLFIYRGVLLALRVVGAYVNAQAGKQLEPLLIDSMLGLGDSIRDDLGCRQTPAR